MSGGTVSLINNTLSQNRCTSTVTTAQGAGIYAPTGNITGMNNIIYGNLAPTNPEFYGAINLNYSCSSVALTGTGNIVDDPEFMNPGTDNFHLMAISPCIDTGDPASPLDPDGTRADIGALPFDQTGGGLLIPNRPTNFDVQHNNAQLIASLSWINPSITANNLPLTELNGVKVYRENVLITTLTNVQIGQPSNYNDPAVPAIGMWEYEIIPYNSHGDGIPAEDSAWIGLDIPGSPSNVLATPDPGQALICTITWTAPTVGGHGGYFPPGAWTGQKIYRQGQLLTTITGTNTTYVDNNIPISGWYNYAVSYYNSSGEGNLANATPYPVFVGPPQFIQIPFNWVEINGVGTNAGFTGDDQNLGPFNIGFNFPYYSGATFNTLRICSNGWTSFTSTTTVYVNTQIPNTAEPNNLVAPLWDDLYTPGGGIVWYYHDVQNGRFVVEWDNVMSYTSPRTPQKFEVIFYPNGNMDFMYHTIQAPCVNQNTVGIENATGTVGVQVTYDGSGPLEPQSQMGIRVLSVATGGSTLDINTSPVNPPIVIPANGGNFQYSINIHNLGSAPATFQVWNKVRDAANVYTQVFGPVTRTLPGGANPTRTLTQTIAGSISSGTLYFISYIGTYPSTIVDSSFFTITKLTSSDGGPWIAESNVYGDFFAEYATVAASAIPDKYSLEQNYPNPFNPLTTISFSLLQAGKVNLTIYDVNGREVARLVDGWRAEGLHQVTFDGTGLASGVYLYRLQAGEFTANGKMVLMK